ncbi:MAG: anthranilate synthase component I [Streptosporangiales bacterium]|nr:anthranilate synthase component I [Streptosporangiales bacterium]
MTVAGTSPSRASRSGVVVPDRATFTAMRQPVVPVTRRLLADGETPVGLYRALAGGGRGTFLLESAETGRSWSRYSFVGVRSRATLTTREGRAVWLGDPPPGVPREGDVLQVLRETVEVLRGPRDPGLPPLTGGMVGYVAYDAVRHLERLPDDTVDDLRLPDVTMLLATDLAVLDHHDGTVLLIANAFPGDDPDAAYDDAVARLDDMTAALRRPADASAVTMDPDAVPRPSCNTPDGGYQDAVERAKEYIRAGDAFQIVPSQRFELRTSAQPLDVYRVLRTTNPSPYMYLLDLGDHHVVGSSPEAHVKVTEGTAMLHPIAGTKPRGATPEDDAALEQELATDPKERAEHLMLVDLGRNDLGRIAASGTVEVRQFMEVERYSHVMHLVSTVVCDLAEGRSAFDVLAATLPAGTLSGAPKVRAMEIIDELESTRRGLYGGTVGYLDFAGDLDMAIAIRTALMRDGVAYVQAGGGIVADSVPDVEDAETRSKAAAVLSAVAVAETFRPA